MPIFLGGVGVVEGRQYKDQHWDLCRALTSQSYIEVIYVTYLANAEYYLYHCCRKGRQAFNLEIKKMENTIYFDHQYCLP